VFIDSIQAMTLSYKTAHAPSEAKTIRIAFEPPLSGYEEVKPRLLSLKLDAEESLGMVPRPHISSFRIPKQVFTQTGPLMAFLLYTTYGTSEAINWLRVNVGGQRTIIGVWWFVVIVHSLESLYTLVLCRRHRTGWVNGVSAFAAALIEMLMKDDSSSSSLVLSSLELQFGLTCGGESSE
jgi:hypothetical protein